MTIKEIRQAIKAGQQVTFHRHIFGSQGFERLPVYGVRILDGHLLVKIGATKRGSLAYGWAFVMPEMGDWVSSNAPLVPFKTETSSGYRADYTAKPEDDPCMDGTYEATYDDRTRGGDHA